MVNWNNKAGLILRISCLLLFKNRFECLLFWLSFKSLFSHLHRPIHVPAFQQDVRGIRGENMSRYGWKQWDSEMPNGYLQTEMNDEYLAGISLRWDSLRICFSLVFGLLAFPSLPLSTSKSFGVFCTHLCEKGGGGGWDVSEVGTVAGVFNEVAAHWEQEAISMSDEPSTGVWQWVKITLAPTEFAMILLCKRLWRDYNKITQIYSAWCCVPFQPWKPPVTDVED